MQINLQLSPMPLLQTFSVDSVFGQFFTQISDGEHVGGHSEVVVLPACITDVADATFVNLIVVTAAAQHACF